MRIQDLKELQLDGIKESANIGSGHAATALSQMLGKKVSVEVPKIEIIPIEKTPELLGRDAGIIVASLTKFFGDVTGRTLIVMSDDNAKTLVKILLNKEMSRDVVIDDMGISSLKEVANILCISRKTVENHRAHIVRKTGVQGQAGLTKYAARIGLIDLDVW